jgi:hypothetical protein
LLCQVRNINIARPLEDGENFGEVFEKWDI